MKTFKDNADRSWTIEVNVATVKRVRDLVGVDLLEKMVEQSRARARSLGVEDRVEFRVADAQDLDSEARALLGRSL